MNSYAVFTAIIGDYDGVPSYRTLDPRFDYILFSNSIKTQKMGHWIVRPIPFQIDNPILTARWVKTHPHILLPEYHLSLWVDANIEITNPYLYFRTIEMDAQGVTVAANKHPERDCAYEEMMLCTTIQFEKETVALRWMRHLYSESYPCHAGLNETGILCRINDQQIDRFNEHWWSYISQYSCRDQASFNYCLWKEHLNCAQILPDGSFINNTPYVNYKTFHQKSQRRVIRRSLRHYPFFYGYHAVHPKRNFNFEWNCIARHYTRFYHLPFPITAARIAGLYYCFLYLIKRIGIKH